MQVLNIATTAHMYFKNSIVLIFTKYMLFLGKKQKKQSLPYFSFNIGTIS